ncbi:MAG: hypothetical protein V2B18_06310 [Pseudomonadota bacterium]
MTSTLPSFARKQDAIDAGFVTARHGLIRRFGPWELMSVDASDGSEIGNVFALRICRRGYSEPDPQIPEDLEFHDLAYSTSIYLTEELNLLRRPGAFTRMYRPGDVEQAIQTAREAWERVQGELQGS